MPVPVACRHNLKVQALAEGHPSTIANDAVSTPPCAYARALAP
jgi:hypothetical protein